MTSAAANPEKLLPLTPRVFHILLALVDGPEHGYQIMKEVETRSEGKVKIEVHQTYPLKDAAQAHRDLEARKTTGSTVLIP